MIIICCVPRGRKRSEIGLFSWQVELENKIRFIGSFLDIGIRVLFLDNGCLRLGIRSIIDLTPFSNFPKDRVS